MAAKIKVLEAALVEKQDEVAELNKKVAALETATPVAEKPKDAPVVTIDKKKYLVTSGTYYGGKKYSREELAKEKAILAKIKAAGTSILVPA